MRKRTRIEIIFEVSNEQVLSEGLEDLMRSAASSLGLSLRCKITILKATLLGSENGLVSCRQVVLTHEDYPLTSDDQ